MAHMGSAAPAAVLGRLVLLPLRLSLPVTVPRLPSIVAHPWSAEGLRGVYKSRRSTPNVCSLP
jgi:hypothetical protein